MLHKKNMFIQKQENNCIKNNTKLNLKKNGHLKSY